MKTKHKKPDEVPALKQALVGSSASDYDTPMKGKTLKEHLSDESNCCCHTEVVCAIHNESIRMSS